MTCDLFSSLDSGSPVSSLLFTLCPLFVAMFMMGHIHWMSNQILMFYTETVSFLFSQDSSSQKSVNMSKLIIWFVFVWMILINSTGMLPWVFCSTSTIWVTVSVSLMLWLSLMLSGIQSNTKKQLAALAPSGSPLVLVPILVLIETISISIRPLTLSIRLLANMSTGHIFLSLMGTMLTGSTVYSVMPMNLMMMLYMMFEMFVCFMQAYIFATLLKIYFEEHP